MVEPITIDIRNLAQDVRLPQEQVQAAIDLLDAGVSIPFIARYRKDVTKNLNEEALRHIDEELRTARALCERKQAILKTIESAGKLAPDLDKNIREAKSVKRLEDIYLFYKPKRQFLAGTARESGLEPFALEILEEKLPPDKIDARAAEFINEDKNVKSVADVLLGAGHIIADIFSCKAELIHKAREILYQHGRLTTTKIEKPGEKKETITERSQEGEETADGRQQTAEERSQESEVRSQEGEETADDRQQTTEGEQEDIPSEEVVEESAAEDTAAEETTEEIMAETSESKEPSDSPAPEDGVQEVSALFEQLKEEQAEKGLPMVRSQNAIKKKKRAEAKKKQDAIKQRQREHFERQFMDYFNFSIKLRGIPAHRILSFNRGERHKIIQVAVHIDEAKTLESVKEICVPPGHAHADFLTGCLQDALHRGVLPMLIREIRNDMTEYAEKNAIKVFGQNLRRLLLQRSFPKKRVLALDSGGKIGHKAAALDEFGNLVGHEILFFAGSTERRKNAEKTLADMIRQFNVSVIAIGNGGGSRLAEEAVAHMIETHFSDTDLTYIIVNKAGSLAYSTSPAAKEEFPNEDTSVRAAVSIGRRLQNPLNELVKIEPIHLGQGMLHHEIRGKYLKQMLDEVVGSCVNAVGVDVNLATPSHLTYVAGLNLMTASRIYEYRREHGAFRTREDLRKVPGINETVYTHAAGFLRIHDGDNPLDSTNIHPESYELAASILEKLGSSVNDLRYCEKIKAIAGKIATEKIGELTVKLASEFNAGLNTVRDILEELSKPGWDPRESQPPPMFRKAMLKLENLTPGMELTGTVLNVTDFGAFVDIGLHESGFIHISQMATGYIQSAHDKVAVGNMVRLWVVEVDVAKKRVSLTLLPPGTTKQPPKSSNKEREGSTKEHAPRPPRPEGERREFSDRPREERPHRDSRRDARGGKRFDKKPSDRSPKTFVSAPVKKEVKPITDKMKQGKEPMRSFSDLAQLFGRVQTGEGDEKR